MSTKKRVLICLGAIVAIALLSFLIATSFDLTDMWMLFLVLGAIVIAGIFIAIMVYGLKGGLILFGGISYIIAIYVFFEIGGSWSWFGIVGLALIFVVPWLWSRWQAKQAEIDPQSYGLAQLEAERIERAMFNGAIYLIRSSKWNPGPVYKVVGRGDILYFCYVGRLSGEIDFDIATNENLTELELLNHKKSFSLPMGDITRVEIKTMRSPITGETPNYGTVSVHVSEQEHKLIIHEANDYEMVEEFFKNITHAPVTVEIDKHTIALQLEEQTISEYAEHSPERLRTLKRLCRALHIIGWVYAVWAFLVSQPQMPLTIIGLLLPTFAFMLYIKNKDIVTIGALSNDKQFRPPSIMGALVVPSFGLMLFALDFNVFHTARLWAAVGVVTIAISTLVFALSDEHKKRKWLRVFIPMVTAFFVYGAVITTNVVFDPTPHPDPANHQFTQLERKWVSSGDWRDSLYFALNVIEHEGNMAAQLTPDNFRTRAGQRNFDLARDDDIVRLCVLPGLWGIPWVQCVTVMGRYRE